MWSHVTRWAFRRTPPFRPPADMAAIHAATQRSAGVPVAVEGAPDVGVDVFRPRAAGPHPLVVWMHGGGFIMGSPRLVANMAHYLAARGVLVAVPAYSLAGIAPYPAPVRQAAATLCALVAAAGTWDIDAGRVALAGDSAGAHIALQAAAALGDPAFAGSLGVPAGGPPGGVGGVVCHSAFLPFDAMGPAAPFGRGLRDTYLWGGPPGPPAADVAPGFPPTFITVGNGDPLRGQSYRLARALAARGVDVETLFWRRRVPPLPHEYALYMDTHAARVARERTLAFLARALGPRTGA
ncbi:MAG: alpha/beta hydrolase [Thermoleophilia bacterium]|nr:alpha/beta hydrolase [Thermoleophilia bacterium]